MLTNYDIKIICGKAIDHYGVPNQVKKCKEELMELLYELEGPYPHLINKEKIIDEIADVLIMCKQMAMVFGENRVGDRMEFKLKRLEERILGGIK